MKKKFWILFTFLILLFLVSSCVGRYPLTMADIFYILIGKQESSMATALFYKIRLSRTVLVLLCGGALALSGSVLQTIFRNPLVSPDVLGVANGCSVGAAISLVFLNGNLFLMEILTFFSGISVVFFAVSLAKIIRGERILAILISGIIMSSLASAIVMLLKYVADPNRQLPAIEFWLMGGFHNASWSDVLLIFPLILCSALILFLLRWNLKILTLGEEEAQTLGIHVVKTRMIAILCATVLVSTVVSVAGVVSWIGLIAPHLVRIYAGENIVKTFLLSFLMGSILLLFADILSRSLFSAELPISILTSFIGAFFLFYLLWKRGT